jgi:hypothetical protein
MKEFKRPFSLRYIPRLIRSHLQQSLRFSGKLTIPEKLYGRDADVAFLSEELKKVITKQKKKSVNFVTGVSGSGKTALVLEVCIRETTLIQS